MRPAPELAWTPGLPVVRLYWLGQLTPRFLKAAGG